MDTARTADTQGRGCRGGGQDRGSGKGLEYETEAAGVLGEDRDLQCFLQKVALLVLMLQKSQWGGVDPVLLPAACEGKAVPQQCHLLLRNNMVVIECLGRSFFSKYFKVPVFHNFRIFQISFGSLFNKKFWSIVNGVMYVQWEEASWLSWK